MEDELKHLKRDNLRQCLSAEPSKWNPFKLTSNSP